MDTSIRPVVMKPVLRKVPTQQGCRGCALEFQSKVCEHVGDACYDTTLVTHLVKVGERPSTR